MKLLLTSAGLTNASLVAALERLAPKPLSQCNAVFIPTAANFDAGDKQWLIDNYNECSACNFTEFDIIDIAALSKEQWLPRVNAADIIFVGGGNTVYLHEHIVQSGLSSVLKDYDQKVWVGISAGSMVCTPSLRKIDSTLYYESAPTVEVLALSLVPFYILPHYNSEHFTELRDARLEEYFATNTDVTYVLDDESGILVDGAIVEVISEGKWRKFN